MAVNEAEIIEYTEKSVFILDYDYENTSEVEMFLNANEQKYGIENSGKKLFRQSNSENKSE